MLWLENTYGERFLFWLFFWCGAAGFALDGLMIGAPGIGSSGALSGLFCATCCLIGHTKLEKLVAGAALLSYLVPQIANVFFEPFMGVAIWAHVGGALAGILLTHRLMAPKPVKAPEPKKAKKR
jgi:membrane associated rhomboid family serine protease